MASFTPDSLETTEEVKKGKTAKRKLVKIKLPRVKGETHAFAAVNGERWQIQRGKEVEVPDYIAEVFQNAEKAQIEADEFEEQLIADEKALNKR